MYSQRIEFRDYSIKLGPILGDYECDTEPTNYYYYYSLLSL